MRWIVLCVTACGGPLPPSIDASVPTVEVMVMTGTEPGSMPIAGRTISFEGQAGIVEVMTDENGRAVGEFVGPGVVRLKNTNNLGDGHQILGVESGDRLCFGGCEPRPPRGTDLIRTTIQLTPYQGAAGYFFSYAGLESDYSTFGDGFNIGCRVPCADPVDIYAIAVDSNLKMLAWTSVADVVFVEGQPIAMSGPWTPADPFTLTVRNAPTGYQLSSWRTSPPSMREFVQSPFMQGSLSLSGPAANLGATMRIETRFESVSAQQTVIANPPVAPSYDLDANTDLLPFLTNLGGGKWTETAGMPYDAIYVFYQRSIGDAPYGNSTLAPAGTQITIPGAIDGFYVMLIDRTDMTYGELRQRDHRYFDQYSLPPPGVTYRRSQASKAGP